MVRTTGRVRRPRRLFAVIGVVSIGVPREAVEDQFGTDAEVDLFGFRVDDDLRGGDRDLLGELEGMPADSRVAVEAKLRTLVEMQRRIGERQ